MRVFLWLLCGYCVAIVWLLCGYCVAIVWLLCGYCVAIVWLMCRVRNPKAVSGLECHGLLHLGGRREKAAGAGA